MSDHPWVVGHTVRARRSAGDGRPPACGKPLRTPDGCHSGEVAGALAAHCVAEGVEPRQVQAEDERYETFARILDRDGVQRHWPDVLGY
ncbi:hypothetical protein ABT218_19995 [Streptomyces sp. NPDC001455]|uniref:hypothetical protein n=1 Tax=unclassified Streptomyces TaxID=2593676 RepID=UPI00331A198A